MIVWSGRGFLSLIVLVLTIFLCTKVFSDSQSDFTFIISFFVAGIFSYVFGIRWNHDKFSVYINEETGKRLNLASKHSLFWIKMQYWGIIFILLGIITLIQNFNKSGFEFYMNIFLGLVGTICLVVFSLNIFKTKSESRVELDTRNTKNKNENENLTKPKFEKEEIKTFKNDAENENRFMPK